MINSNLGSKKHCQKVCQNVNKINHTLNNLVHQLRHRSPATLTLLYPRSSGQQRVISPEYIKVTETVNNINGVEQLKIARHYTDNSQMRKALEWDSKDQFKKPQQEYYSKVIKMKHDQRTQELQKLRNQSRQKQWQRVTRSQKYQDKQYYKGQSPRFNNQMIQKKTEQYSVSKRSNHKEEKIAGQNRQNQQQSQDYSQKRTKAKKRGNNEKGDYMYRKKTVIRYRSDEVSDSSTDSEFSRFQL